jgi:hypothetical protein
MEETVLPLPLTPLLELELAVAIEQRLFRGEIVVQQAMLCQRQFQDDMSAGIYQRCLYEGEKEFHQALRLVRQYTAELGCRALDIMHVAAALCLGIKEFLTYDQRQKKLVQEVGMKVVHLGSYDFLR